MRRIGARAVRQGKPRCAKAVERIAVGVDDIIIIQAAWTCARQRINQDAAVAVAVQIALNRRRDFLQGSPASVDRVDWPLAIKTEYLVDVAEPIGHALGRTLQIDHQYPALLHRPELGNASV